MHKSKTMKKTFLFIFLLSCISFFAQIKFEKGYFISNDGQKHEVLIKNEDWLNNPTEFIYKQSETDSPKTGKISEVTEFQVYGYNKLVRYKGKIENSSNDLQNLSTTEEPEWKDIEVYIYKLNNGKINLYSYYKNNKSNFFYSENGGEIKPLIYKEYSNGEFSLMYKNDIYKTQLETLFSDNIDVCKLIKNTEYNGASLLKIFNKYNNSENQENLNKSKSKLNLTLKPGINFAEFDLKSYSLVDYYNVHFKSNEIRFGIEIEYVIPYNRNKWSLFLEPAYNNISSEALSPNKVYTAKLDYSFIEFNLGARHYMNLNSSSKFFVDLSIPAFILNMKDGEVNYTSSNFERTLYFRYSTSNFAFGAGYVYKNKFSIKASTSLKRSLTSNLGWDNYYNYNTISIGYNIF